MDGPDVKIDKLACRLAVLSGGEIFTDLTQFFFQRSCIALSCLVGFHLAQLTARLASHRLPSMHFSLPAINFVL